MSNLHYINYQIPYGQLYELLKGKKQINIFIDLNSIVKGFYNRILILEELNFYIENKRISDKLITELKQYLTNLFNNFKPYNPKFILFYDTGINGNYSIDPDYKSNRTNLSKTYIQTDDERELYYHIKNYYFNKIYKVFKLKKICSVIFLENVETDFVPYYAISKEFLNSDKKETLNLILSVDKDLLQCCDLNNTYQSVCLYSTKDKKFILNLYDDNTAISYITKKQSSLKSKYIPTLLSLSGDKSDNISGLPGIGPIKAEKLICENNLNVEINNLNSLPSSINNYKQKLINNFKLISFKEQIERLQIPIYLKINEELNYAES